MADKKDKDMPDWSEDDLVARLVPDPGQLPELQVLAGFLGRSDRPGYWRIYLTPQLDEYVECRVDDVRHIQRLEPQQQGTLGGTMVWLDEEATVQRTQSTKRAAEADFLQGAITEEFLATARLSGVETELALRTIIIRISRRICPRPSSRGPCTVPSLCNRCLPQ